MCKREFAASCTSRRTCSELFECCEKMRMNARLCWMARVISPEYDRPGITSRGAIQQGMPAASSEAHAAFATARLLEECEMKTSCAIAGSQSRSPRYFFAGMYFQLRALPSLSHLIDLSRRSLRVSSRFASVTHSMYSRRWLGEKSSKVFRAFEFFLSAAVK